MKSDKQNAKYATCLRRLERMTYERNMLLEAVFFIRKIARYSPDEHMFFVGACDEVLEAIAAYNRRNEKRKN
jgi:hypothetical protein